MAQAPHVAARALVVLLLCAGACGSRASSSHSPPAPARMVAVGDLHGDLEVTRAVLELAGAIDGKGHWSGGRLVVVQLGDQLDRGDGERDILELFDRLAGEAAAAGGAVIALNGNHELMNAAGDFRYVTPAGFAAFGGEDGRRAAFRPGGPYARRLAERPIYAIVGDTLFVHGGVLPAHLDYGLERMDREARAWLRGDSDAVPVALADEDSPLWTRRYGLVVRGGADEPAACADAAAVLARLKLRRMVVAHTVHDEGMSAICDGRVWRIDVGLAHLYGGPLQALELRGDAARVLTPR